MMSPERESVIRSAKRVVVKLGTAVLTDAQGRLDENLLSALVNQIAALRKGGCEVLVVSSGAVGAGLAEMGLADRPKGVADIQALAAIGQSELMRRWHDGFKKHDLHVAQVLLSRTDLHDRQRYLNARNALERLLQMGVVPVVNENDTTAVDELTFGDNDLLAAILASAVDAQMLFLLTVTDGLLDSAGELVGHVEAVDGEVMGYVQSTKSSLGRGGMESKLLAAKTAMTSGVAALIAHGKTERVLERLFEGEALGTFFEPAKSILQGKKRWIAHGLAQSDHCLVIDDGAAKALRENGKSLLPIGVREVRGEFGCGEVVEIRDMADKAIGRGLVNHTSEQARQAMGKPSVEVTSLLGDDTDPTIVHRDNLIIYP